MIVSLLAPPRGGGAPNATETKDYRAILAIGPFTIPAGDSIHIAVAWTLGYGFGGMVKNSQVAQNMFDGNYSKAPAAPDEPQFVTRTTTDNGQNSVAVQWKKNAEASVDPLTGAKDFGGYAVYKTVRQDAGGNPIWDTLAVYVKNNAIDRKKDTLWYGRPYVKSWPPPSVFDGKDTVYQLLDRGVLNGMIYTYLGGVRRGARRGRRLAAAPALPRLTLLGPPWILRRKMCTRPQITPDRRWWWRRS